MQRVQTICLITLTVIAIGFSMKFLASVLLPFVIACFVVIGIRPLLSQLQNRLKMNRLVAVGVAFMAGLIGLGVVGFMIAVSVKQVTANSNIYQQRLTSIGNWIDAKAQNWNLGDTKSDKQEADKPKLADETLDLGSGKVKENKLENDATQDLLPFSEIESELENDTETASSKTLKGLIKQLDSLLFSLVGSMSSLLSQGIMILLFVFFLLMENESSENRPKLLAHIEHDVRKYLVLKTVISIVTGIVFGGILWLFDVPMAILFGMLAFLLNFIPNIGPLIANVLPVPFLILNSEISPVSAIICIVLISAVQFISGNVVETRLMGKSMDVSPIVLLLALMFFGLVWGIVGMFLATPLVSILKIVLQNTPTGRPAAELLAGRWVEKRTV